MTFMFVSQGVGKPIIVVDLLAKYGKPKTGRWAKAPDEPDRCYYCPLSDIKPSVGFVEDGEGWRYGYCAEHKAKARV
jgi:formate dehydrogenase maturation protein FdhE